MASIKYKDNGEYKDIVVKVGDTQPIGTIVDYDGSTIPNGWQQVENVLWENTSPTTAIENGAEFSLSSSDYDYYSIIYNLSTSGTNISFNTEKIPKGQGTVLSIITSGASNFSGLQRNINHTSDTKLTSGVPYSFNNSSRSIDNTALIPTKIIGYKKQIKKIAPVTPPNGLLENTYGTSQENGYSQAYINKFTDYSTTEQVIGKWGSKPLYRKVIEITSPSNSNTNYVDLLSYNIDTLTHLYGFYRTNNGTFGIPFYDSADNMSVMFLGGTRYLRGRFGNNYAEITEARVVLEYTKTTD